MVHRRAQCARRRRARRLSAERTRPDDAIERAGPVAWPDALIAGVDEAGRGPLAGPVVAATVVLDPGAVPDGLDDSKRLGPNARERLSDDILRAARACAIVAVPAPVIDRVNVRAASLLAMSRAVRALAARPDRALIDGDARPPDLPCRSDAIVGGDRRSISIAAASILAKVARDRMMVLADAHWPAYGFKGHKGYPTKAHREAIEAHGPCPLHRMSFGALKGWRG